jgi:PAS domain S-box-containing protein
MKQFLTKWWYRLSCIGISEQLKIEQKQQVSLVNRTAIVSFFLNIFLCVALRDVFPISGYAYYSFFLSCLYLAVLLLNFVGWYLLAALYLFFLYAFSIFIVSSIFGYDSNVHLLFIVLFFATVMGFGASNKKNLLIALSMPVVFLTVLYLTDFAPLFNQKIFSSHIEQVKMIVSFVLMIGAVFLSYLYVNRTEKNKERLKAEISEKERNANLLKQSEAKLKTLIENTKDNIWAIDTQFRLITMNSSFLRTCKNVYGLSLKEGDNILDSFPEGLVKYWKPVYERAFKGETFKIEWAYFNTFLNRQIEVETQVCPIFDSNQQIQGATFFSRDITQRKQAERLIKQKDEMLRAINQNIKEGIFRSTVKEGGLYVNEAYVKMFGFDSVEEALRTPPNQIYVHEEDRIRLINKMLQDKQVTNEEVLYKRKDGTSFWALVSAIVTQGENGELYFDGTIKDITELKNIQVQLKKAKEMAEQLAASKTQFLSAMSHEIRTPLNAIIGISHLLLEENPKPEQIENLTTLRFSAQNLLALINDILDFNKIDAGKVVLESIDFNLRELVQNLKKGFQITADTNKNLLLLEIDEQIPIYVKGDPTRLSQILTNLIGNALKFTQKGKVTLRLDTITKTAEETQIKFTVADTGIGIPKEKQEIIFEGFTQATDETTRKYGGTGLGLSITKKLLEMQNSQIYLESEVGKGSKFYFTLSFKIGQEKEDDKKITNYELGAFNKEKILLVEDNLANQLVAKRFLTKWGLQVSIAEDGEIALKMLQYEDFDLVLMDIQMPNMNGYEATTAIRKMKQEKYRKLPIIALTASVNSGIDGKILSAGMNDYVLKPFEPEELHHKIASFLPPKNN